MDFTTEARSSDTETGEGEAFWRPRVALIHAELTEGIIGAAIEVHKNLGPGLLEYAYEECLCHELQLREIDFKRQVALPVIYKNAKLDCGYRLDVVVQQSVIVEVKAVEQLSEIHEAQLMTYLRLAHIPVGLLINFNVPVLKQGILRRVV
jgi:GxxExxY protein